MNYFYDCFRQRRSQSIESDDPYVKLVIDASISPEHGGIASELRIRSYVSDHKVYRCDIVTVNGAHEHAELRIKFDGKCMPLDKN